jgi:dihydrofolate synthase/folylpolyglutamate synthase
MQDKAFREMIQILFPIAQQIVVTQARNPRAASTVELAEAARTVGTDVVQADSVPEAIHAAAEMTPKNGIVVITGSIFVVGEAMKELAIVP